MKLFAKILFFFTMPAMQKRTAIFTLIVCVASAFAVTAHAQERLSQLQTELSNTSISGYVQSELTFVPPQNTFRARNRTFLGQRIELSRSQNTEITSLTPIAPSFEENALYLSSSFVLMSVDSFYQTSPPPVSAPDSSIDGADMIEATRAGDGFAMQPVQNVMPPTPDFQISQAGIQPVPEPSTFALGSLAIALIALVRLSKRQQVLKS
jgi:hypothetical protein